MTVPCGSGDVTSGHEASERTGLMDNDQTYDYRPSEAHQEYGDKKAISR
jgi:hypothetical protein